MNHGRAFHNQRAAHPLKLDDHSKLDPPLPIPNRTVKRLRADDSAGSRVKVGHRQALTAQTALPLTSGRAFCFGLARSTSAGAQHSQLPVAL